MIAAARFQLRAVRGECKITLDSLIPMRVAVVSLLPIASLLAQAPPQLQDLTAKWCAACHTGKSAQSGLDFASLSFDLNNRTIRDRWIRIHDRIEKGEMPPKAAPFDAGAHSAFLEQLEPLLRQADLADAQQNGRGPMRRLNRDEYEQNLRDLLHLPNLDIRDMLPEDREAHHSNKVADTLDMSRVQLVAYLDAAEAALRQATVTTPAPPPVTRFRTSGVNLFPGLRSTGTLHSMFFIKDNRGVNVENERARPMPKELQEDPALEMGLFRSPGWPYGAFPRGFAAPHSGEYRVRFSARAVLQHPGFRVSDATQTVPMTLRSRRPTNHDIAEDVKSVGGILRSVRDRRSTKPTCLCSPARPSNTVFWDCPSPKSMPKARRARTATRRCRPKASLALLSSGSSSKVRSRLLPGLPTATACCLTISASIPSPRNPNRKPPVCCGAFSPSPPARLCPTKQCENSSA